MIRLVSSYIFFFFFVFTILALGVSKFSATFSQLFFLLCKDGMVYSVFTKIFYLLIALGALCYILFSHQDSRITKSQDKHLLRLMVSGALAVVFCFIIVFAFCVKEDFIQQLQFHSHHLAFLNFWDLVATHRANIGVAGFFYLFFLYLPLLFWLSGAHFNLQKSLHQVGYTFFPSINVCILTLFASSFQPYYDRSNPYLYIDWFIFFGALVLLFVLFLRKRFLFGFYEYANLLFFIFWLYLLLVCSDVLASANYFNVRKNLYIFAFLVWCYEWMFEDFFAAE